MKKNTAFEILILLVLFLAVVFVTLYETRERLLLGWAVVVVLDEVGLLLVFEAVLEFGCVLLLVVSGVLLIVVGCVLLIVVVFFERSSQPKSVGKEFLF